MNHFKPNGLNIFTWLIVYFTPTYPLILVIGFFIIADTITGVQASLKRGEMFSSKRLRNSIAKFSAYGLAVMVALLIQRHFIVGFPAMQLIAGLIAYTELKSIDENIKSITGVSVFKAVIKQLTPEK